MERGERCRGCTCEVLLAVPQEGGTDVYVDDYWVEDPNTGRPIGQWSSGCQFYYCRCPGWGRKEGGPRHPDHLRGHIGRLPEPIVGPLLTRAEHRARRHIARMPQQRMQQYALEQDAAEQAQQEKRAAESAKRAARRAKAAAKAAAPQ